MRVDVSVSIFESFIQEILQEILRQGLQDSKDSMDKSLGDFDTDSNAKLKALFNQIAKVQYVLSQTHKLDSNETKTLKDLQTAISEPMKVAIIGQFSSGKSTFLNALLGKEVLPSGITPVTAKVCEIVYGDDFSLEIIYKNGKVAAKSIDFLQEVDDLENAKISHYRLYAPLALLKSISFLDTPGFNSQRESDTQTTNEILKNVDGIIWLTLIDNVGKNSEIEILQKYIKNYANKSLCVLNQKDRLKNENEVQTSLNYAKSAFDSFFESIVAISAKNALDSTKSNESYKNSNIESVINFLQDSISPKAAIAKEYRIKRTLKSLLLKEKKRLHKNNMCYKDLINIVKNYIEKLRFNILQNSENGGFEKRFTKIFNEIDSNFSTLSSLIFNAFELRDIEVVRIQKNMLGIKKENVQVKKASFLPKERLINELNSDEFELFRECKKIGFKLSSIGSDFYDFSRGQEGLLLDEIKGFIESSLNYLGADIIDKCGFFNLNVLKALILNDIFMTQDNCINELNKELNYLQKAMSDNYKATILLTLERLNYEVYNALQKHKKEPDTLPLYNPTFENTRALINEGLHFNIYQEKLSLNFPLYKKTIWNLTHNLSDICDKKITKINDLIESNKTKIIALSNAL